MLENEQPPQGGDEGGVDRGRALVRNWSPFGEGLGVALWTSFIAACFETMVVFAFFDPVTLGFDGFAPPLLALRPILYAFGFFFFWFFAFIGTSLTAYLLESGPHSAARRNTRPEG